MLAEPDAFEANLGREDPAGLALRFRETSLGDPDQLASGIAASEPDVVLVTPSFLPRASSGCHRAGGFCRSRRSRRSATPWP
jgi:hypothetical protein